MSSIFISGFGGRLPPQKLGNDEGLVPPAIVPGPGVGDSSVALLPLLRFFVSPDQRKHCAGHYGNVGAANDFKQAKRMRHFFVAPLVSTDHRDPQYFDLWGLDHDEESLQVATPGPGAILIDDDLAARLGWRK